MKKYKISVGTVIVVIAFILVVFIGVMASRASLKRWVKSLGSEFNDGIERTVTVYDYNGNTIRSWEGRFDVIQGETGIMFDGPNGRRVIISGGIVINEEK